MYLPMKSESESKEVEFLPRFYPGLFIQWNSDTNNLSGAISYRGIFWTAWPLYKNIAMNISNIRVFNPLRYNAKREQLNKEKQQTIYHNNLSLLRKIEGIEQRKPSQRQPFLKDSLNISLRVKDCRRINRQNGMLALRLQSQQSHYSKYICKPAQHKRAHTSMSACRHRPSISLEPRSNSRRKTQLDDSEVITQTEDGYRNRVTICNQRVEIDGKSFWLEFSRNGVMYFITLEGCSTPKRYKLRLTEKVGDYLYELIDINKFSFGHRISSVKGNYVLRIPFGGFVRTYNFWQLKQTPIRSRNSPLKEQHQKLKRELLSSIQSGGGTFPQRLVQQRKQVLRLRTVTPQSLISQSQHSYMYQCDC